MKTLEKSETMELFQDDAKEGAKIVCGNGTCLSCFGCGHANRQGDLPKTGKGDTCPVAKYDVEPDPRSFAERLAAGDVDTNMDDVIAKLVSVCACCEHAHVVEQDDRYEIEKTDEDFHDYCMDCPVNMHLDGIHENMAEAAMS